MSQPERFATLTKFRTGELRLLVCSDVAARGLDIGGLSHVFNFDVPIHAEDYVHRIGRTGRAGMTGHAYTLATPHDGAFVEAIEKLIGTPIPRIQVEGFAPLEFAESDGRRRRGGRARTASKPVKPKAKADTFEDATAIAIPVPKKGRRKAAPAKPAPVPVDMPQPELVDTRPPPPARDRDRDRDRDRRRERYRRDDDLGPPVLGFGDEVPAFMLLRARASKVHASAKAE
jgi:superfamily II DNA/RNA helicase